ncbi:MAG: ABC transporter substrate-binding protein [Geminicoccaceae bacterium]
MHAPWLIGAAAAALVSALAMPALAAPPANPLVVEVAHGPGKRGGDLLTLIGRTKDVRLMVVYGYARLVGYTTDYEIAPDILESVEVEDGRVFTLKLREGHNWSDGQPFTSEDFRYWWEDIALNEKMYPVGPPVQLMVDGELPTFEVIDETTVRYSWAKPNPFFLPALAAATPLFIYMPAHYLKQFHPDHADQAELEAMIKATESRDWAHLHGRKDEMYNFTNIELPTLQPWKNITDNPATRFIGERNEYFHRVDTNGVQLPYIDRLIFDVVDSKLTAPKAGAGETDLQARGLAFADYTFLKENEQRVGTVTRLWKTARGAHLALYPNLNAKDEVWRELFRDARFRQALSLAVDREAINATMYYTLAIGGQNTVLPESPLYRPELRDVYTDYDLAEANRLLDEIGLTARTPDGLRKLPDGRPLEIIVETAGEDTEQTDILGLVNESWREIGVKIFTKPSQREVLRNRVFSGDTLMSIWYGLENGIPTAAMPPSEFAPTSQQQLQWPQWGQHYETMGEAGTPPDEPEAQRLLELFESWQLAAEDAERKKIWDEMLTIYAEQVYSIALISGVLQPVVHKAELKGVPEEAVFNWDPGAQFGIYRPDTFYWNR